MEANRFIRLSTILSLSASLTLAQTPNVNQRAADTLTIEVARAVFSYLKGTKADEIHKRLIACGSNCDPQSIIRNVGSWDRVGKKLDELALLKNREHFRNMPSGEANTAIRQELAQFYNRYKNVKNYAIPLNPDVQERILAKIDMMLPPTAVPQSLSVVASQQDNGKVKQNDTTNLNASIDPRTFQLGQSDQRIQEEHDKRLWMVIASGIIGLFLGAGAVYFLLYRAMKNEVDRLTDTNRQLSQDLNAARRSKVGNEPRHQSNTLRQTDTYTPQRPDRNQVIPDRDDPRRASPNQNFPNSFDESAAPKSVEEPVPANPPTVRSGDPVPGNPAPDAPGNQPMVAPVTSPGQFQGQSTAPMPTRSDVFYFPPPDPTGQFDNAQRADMLLPESAYRFSTNAGVPNVATFRFEAEPGRVARFLTYRNYMIEPACDSENSFSSTYTRVVNRRDGEAVLENGVWRVKTKALIRYE